MKSRIYLFMLVCTFVLTHTTQAQNSISLAGTWRVQLDPDSTGITKGYFNKIKGNDIKLPGTLDEAGYGTKTKGADYGILTRKYKYVGPAWYQREFEVPQDWKNKNVTLLLERVMWQSQVWIDGKQFDIQEGLGTPHYHTLLKLKPGKHTITVRVNNDMIYNIGDKGHSYGEYTQIIWNGMLGKIELEAQPEVALSNVQVWPNHAKKQLTVNFASNNGKNKVKLPVTFKLIDKQTNEVVNTTTQTIVLAANQAQHSQTIAINKDVKTWSEFSPNVYALEVSWNYGKSTGAQTVDFGFRNVGASKSKVLINNTAVYMRGNLDCLHFPLTGYPSTDVKEWERIFKIYKSYGLNQVRFHSWCPPEAAFVAADKLGIYIMAEVLWIDWWMSVVRAERPEMTTKGLPKGMGYNASADAFVPAEMQRMLDAYGNHPSFVFMCIGNELGNSDFDVMEKWVKELKDKDNRRLYSVSTARKIMPVDQYMVTHNIPNVGGTYRINPNGTDSDLEANYSKAEIPIIAHEVGQFPVYPLWSEINKYKGVLEARNLEELKALAAKNDLLGMDEKFHMASGNLQNILYKALIENSMRTPSSAGFTMLSMTDYSGQGEALIGWLDSFWDSKGYLKPSTFRGYSNTVVPLTRFKKYTWQNNETFTAVINVANYSDKDLNNAITWEIKTDDGQILGKGELNKFIKQGQLNSVGAIEVALNDVTKPVKATLTVSVNNTSFTNFWNIWIYPPVDTVDDKGILVKNIFDTEAIATLEKGGKVLLVANKLGKDDNITPINFESLFWSTSFFPGQSNRTLGLYIDKNHPAFNYFPTDMFNDWQWKAVSRGNSYILNNFKDITPIVQSVSDFHINDRLGSIFEVKVGNGKLLVCGHDINADDIVAKQLKYSLQQYMKQPAFNPTNTITVEQATQMFSFIPKAEVAVPKGFENAALYVLCGENKGEGGSQSWNKNLDVVKLKDKNCDYTVTCDDVWKDDKGEAWTGKEITVDIKTPNGIIGDIYVKLEDWNNQNRSATLYVENREFKVEPLRGKDRWVKLFVMREDTNDGSVRFKARVKDGGNIMISEFALIKN